MSEFIDGKEYSHSVDHAMAALVPIGEPAVPVLVQLLYTELRVEASSYLRMIGEPAEDYLILLLDDEDPQVRRRAAEALLGTTNPAAVELLTKLLDDEYVYVANMARLALGRMQTQHTPVESTFDGREREFFLEDEKREWMDSLVPIVKGRSVYIEPYFHPNGPVIGYGLDYREYLAVDFLLGSEVNESYMDKIYGVIDEKARENCIEEVPVLFSFESMPVEDEAIEEDVHSEYLGSMTDENKAGDSAIHGFVVVILVIFLLEFS